MLPRWRRRVLAYRVIGALPGGERLFDWYRVSHGGLQRWDLRRSAPALREMARLLRGAGTTVEGRDLVEIGAGWHPVLPVVFYGMGARSIVMSDICSNMRQQHVERTVESCIERAPEIATFMGADEATLVARWSDLRPGRHRWLEVWESRGITYRAPSGLHTLPSASVDIVFSNDCLNYIPLPDLRAIAAECARVLRLGGLGLYNIGVYDDLTVADRSIPSWNFLRFGDEEWERIGNARLHRQNRLRPRAYASLFADSRLRPVWDERVAESSREPDLDRSLLHPDFRDLPADELLCKHYLLAVAKQEVPVA